MRSVVSRIIIVAAVAFALFFGSGGPVASAHGLGLVPLCGYTIAASEALYDSTGTHIAQLRIWNYTCTNQAHAQVYSDVSYCIYVYSLDIYNNNEGKQSSGGPANLCGSGSSVNTGVVPYQAGAMQAVTQIGGQLYTLSNIAQRI